MQTTSNAIKIKHAPCILPVNMADMWQDALVSGDSVQTSLTPNLHFSWGQTLNKNWALDELHAEMFWKIMYLSFCPTPVVIDVWVINTWNLPWDLCAFAQMNQTMLKCILPKLYCVFYTKLRFSKAFRYLMRIVKSQISPKWCVSVACILEKMHHLKWGHTACMKWNLSKSQP